MRDGTARPGTPPELLSFSDWAAIATAARDAVEASPYLSDKEIKYVWPKVRDHLSRCGVLIGPSGIEIRPYHPPTALNAGYSQAKQRLYLSATLGSMDDLQRRVGGGRITRLVTEGHCQVERSGRGRQSHQPHASHMTWGFTRTHRLKSWSDCST